MTQSLITRKRVRRRVRIKTSNLESCLDIGCMSYWIFNKLNAIVMDKEMKLKLESKNLGGKICKVGNDLSKL